MNKFAYSAIRKIFNAATYGVLGMEVIGEENIPKEGPFIVVCNHASNFDPPLLGTAMRHRLIYFMAKEELFHNPLMAWFLRYVHTFPVHRGRIDRQAVIESFKTLKGGHVLGIFPEGKRTRGGKVGPFHEGFAGIAIKAKVPVLPAAILNSEFLPKKTGPVRVIFGKPVMPPQGRASDHDLVKGFSDEIRDIIIAMQNQYKGDVK
ncbi:1-acyl-sn-glycerol-3-phosphate acyltransferase [uncultured Megasphaera sp.]|uniref:lysophospholipid acyltransferase family protein n=1 Tax=uncultured Megasphaera sp. TaxID=165188 RepID=UPI0025E6FB04|nr:lysophospholipid acyltransferase family protein [uncultured Megasphaera sp.]